MDINTSKNIITITSNPINNGYTYIHVIWKLTTKTDILNPNSDEIIHEYYVNSSPGQSTKTLSSDGYYIIYEFYLPNTIGNYYHVRTDGTAKHVYDPNGNLVAITDLLVSNISSTNIVRVSQTLFHLYNLTDLYASLIKTKFLKNLCSCCDYQDSIDKKILDSLTMGLSLIDILNSYTQFFESQRIVEQLDICTNMILLPCNCHE